MSSVANFCEIFCNKNASLATLELRSRNFYLFLSVSNDLVHIQLQSFTVVLIITTIMWNNVKVMVREFVSVISWDLFIQQVMKLQIAINRKIPRIYTNLSNGCCYVITFIIIPDGKSLRRARGIFAKWYMIGDGNSKVQALIYFGTYISRRNYYSPYP